MKNQGMFLLVILLMCCTTAFEVGARPHAGNKTLGLSMTEFVYESGTDEACDKDGENCTDTSDYSRVGFGLGGHVGYLISDLIEIGGGLGVSKHNTETEYKSSGLKQENDYLHFTGGLYGKAHLGNDEKMVPFLRGGGALDITYSEYKSSGGLVTADDTSKQGMATLELIAGAGIDYYVAEYFAVTGSINFWLRGTGIDPDTDDDNNGTTRSSRKGIRLGLGVATYF